MKDLLFHVFYAILAFFTFCFLDIPPEDRWFYGVTFVSVYLVTFVTVRIARSFFKKPIAEEAET